MRRSFILFIIAFFFFSSCLKDSLLFSFEYTGTVIDELTNLPVEGASVCIGTAMYCETAHNPTSAISEIVKTKSDGSFKIRISKQDIEASDRDGCPKIWATKENYKGSLMEKIAVNSGEHNITIKLYHYAHLKLHVKHDPVNDNVDKVEIWVSTTSSYSNEFRPIEYKFVCRGENSDSTFTITNMWSNVEYSIAAGAVGRSREDFYYYGFRKTLIPDSITNIDLSFGFDKKLPNITQIFNPNLNYESVSDIEGNYYKTIIIGTQTWMAENLKSTRYNNGDLIPTTIAPNLNILYETAPKYQWAYNGDLSKVEIYGRLYTGIVVDDYRNICPSGWHVPVLAEWDILESYLQTIVNVTNDNTVVKSLASTTGWSSGSSGAGCPGNNQLSNNSSGFSALPGGLRVLTGKFRDYGAIAEFWTNWEDGKRPSRVILNYNSRIMQKQETDYIGSLNGYSIRCIKD